VHISFKVVRKMSNKKFKPRLPRGIYDIPPEKYKYYLWLLELFRETCNRYGFNIMEPATIEFFETLSLKSGPDIAKEIYEFLDKAGRRLGLRFDLTVGITRYIVSNPQIPKPIRLAAFSVQWRYDEPQFGRYRSFYAWDIEIFGGDEAYSTVEVITFINDFLSKTGLKNFNIHISDRRFLEKVIRTYSPDGDVLGIMRALDKWGKISKDEIIQLIYKSGGRNAEELIKTVFENRDPLGLVEEYNANTLKKVYSILHDTIGIKNVVIDPSIVRGLDYYDGIVFEVKVKDVEGVGAIVGGGAYRRLTELMGVDLNAVGAAGGVERLLITLEKQNVLHMQNKVPKIIVIPITETLTAHAIKVANDIRQVCNACVVSPVALKSLKGWLKYMSKEDYDYAVFIGEKELKTKTLNIKNLKTREEKTIPYETKAILGAFTNH